MFKKILLPLGLLTLFGAACAPWASPLRSQSDSTPPARAPLATPTLLFPTSSPAPAAALPLPQVEETPSSAPVVAPTALSAASPAPVSGACAYVWASQPLPEISASLFASLQASGLQPESVQASAYGENCVDASGSVVSFAAMQTDYALILTVASLSDSAELGQALYIALLNLEALLPVGSTPGPNPGQVTIVFSAPEGESRLNLARAQAIEALQAGKNGQQLLLESGN